MLVKEQDTGVQTGPLFPVDKIGFAAYLRHKKVKQITVFRREDKNRKGRRVFWVFELTEGEAREYFIKWGQSSEVSYFREYLECKAQMKMIRQ